jgi:hypothetical protein
MARRSAIEQPMVADGKSQLAANNQHPANEKDRIPA